MEDQLDRSNTDASEDVKGLGEGWKNKPLLSSLKEEFNAVLPSQRKHMADIQEWNDLLNIEGKAKPPEVKGRSKIQPKLIRKQAEWRYSSLTEPFHTANKMFNVLPATWEDEDAAKQNTLLLNWQWRTKINRVKFIDDLIRSTVDDGTCITRVGWIQATKMEEVEIPVFDFYPIEDEESMVILQQAMELKQSNPRGYEDLPDELKEAVTYTEENQIPVYAEFVGSTTVEQETVIDNYPTVEVLDPKNVFIDPSCNGDIDKAMFVINSYETNRAELQKQGIFHNLDNINWDDASTLNNEDHYTSTPEDYNLKDKARKKIVAYDYWGYFDIYNTGELVPIVVTWIGNTIIRMSENPYPDGKPPFIVTVYMPVKRQLYGEPDASILEDNQRTLGAIMRGMVDVMGKSANGQTGYMKGLLDPVNKRKFENDQDYEFNPNNHPTQGIYQHVFPELPSSAMNMLELQNFEAESLTGVKSFSGGMSGNAYGDVAAGIRGMLDAASKREMAILRRIADGIRRIGYKCVAMNSTFLTKDEVVRVTNQQYVEITLDDLKGSFDLEVDIATAEVDDAKANDLGFMLQTIGPTVDTQITLQILAEIAELKRMPKLANDLRTFQPQPSPEEQEMMQLDLEIKRAELAKLQSEAMRNEAMARKALTEADSNDQDFLNEETGVKHQREMEKQQAQAEGNMKLETHKAGLDMLKQANASNSEGNKIKSPGKAPNPTLPVSSLERDNFALRNPGLNLGSGKFDPSLDPALNQARNLY